MVETLDKALVRRKLGELLRMDRLYSQMISGIIHIKVHLLKCCINCEFIIYL